MTEYVFSCPQCHDMLIQSDYYYKVGMKAPFCERCGSQRVLIHTKQDASKPTEKQEIPDIKAVKPQKPDFPIPKDIELRKPEEKCLAQGHYCATMRETGNLVCLQPIKEEEKEKIVVNGKEYSTFVDIKPCNKNKTKTVLEIQL
jgi:hypothetical protein